MTDTRVFLKTVVPSVIAFALSGVYTIVDGLFLGNSLGDIGLACITLGYPITAFIQALGTGIGLSGAIRFTILRHQDKEDEAKISFRSTVLLLSCVSLCLSVVVIVALPILLELLGAKGESFDLTAEYVSVIALGATCQIFATGLVPFIRNLGGSTFAMGAMILGFVINSVLDYLFVWVYHWGMSGAALATIIGQAATAILAVFFTLKRRMPFNSWEISLISYWKAILKLAFAPFGLVFATQITAILLNRYLMTYGNAQSVAVYGCISYVTTVVYLLLQGVGDGTQPLISRYFGRKQLDKMLTMRSLSYKASFGVSMVCSFFLWFTSNWIGILFGTSLEASQEIAAYLPLFLFSLVAYAYVRMTISFLYAIAESTLSYSLVFSEPVLIFMLLNVLPHLSPIGIWLSVPIAQLLTSCLAYMITCKVDKSLKLNCALY
ncbi:MULTISPECIES: MATE family efflux transporter [unclassified Granulicatella]|uniref:MATE family efflux transporter n=1 Tax=unclassified Granulicatella TaxID=2630493 RepID=UPI0010743464|nr:MULTISPECIES: MATE family efflux transporter [unclassified Granulicatella]MBF0780927.1 multidrug transporter MatE [Granulicatella sp. 19428wC4_WM01]TFU93205.1 multidrug transporter MatE [Granulicatella sp. WM01]